MKQSIKLGLLLILALLVQCAVMGALEDICKVPPPHRLEKCYVSQNHLTPNRPITYYIYGLRKIVV